MPGMYSDNDYDLAGFCVGAVERSRIIDGTTVCAGDIVLGLASSGIHSNGFSLVRKLIEVSKVDYNDPCSFENGKTFGEALLCPTKIYVKSCLAALKADCIKGLSHITGGGFVENMPRILPPGVKVDVDASLWKLPPVFEWLRTAGNITPIEMAKTFNCGIGMAVIVPADKAEQAKKIFEKNGEVAYYIGTVSSKAGDEPSTTVNGCAGSWGYSGPWTAKSTQ